MSMNRLILALASSVVLIGTVYSSSEENHHDEIKDALKKIGGGDPNDLRAIEELEFDKNAEELPCTVLEKHSEYEIREYPRSKWVCAKDVIDIDHDPMINWRERFNNDPFKALADPVWKHHKDTEMHYHLLAYFFGANDEHKKIRLTKPCTMRVRPMPGSGGKAKVEACIWAGSKWQSREMPKPKSNKVYFQMMKKIRVYVRTFGGYPLSYMDWVREDLRLRMCLKEEEKKVSSSSEESDPKKVIVDGATYRIGGSNAQWKDPFGSDETLRRKLKKSIMDNSDEDVFEQKYSLESKEHHSKLPKGKPERLNSFCVNYQSPFKRDNRRHEIWIVRIED